MCCCSIATFAGAIGTGGICSPNELLELRWLWERLKNLEEPISEDEIGDDDRVAVPALVLVEVEVSEGPWNRVTGIRLDVVEEEFFPVKIGAGVEVTLRVRSP